MDILRCLLFFPLDLERISQLVWHGADTAFGIHELRPGRGWLAGCGDRRNNLGRSNGHSPIPSHSDCYYCASSDCCAGVLLDGYRHWDDPVVVHYGLWMLGGGGRPPSYILPLAGKEVA